MGDTYLWLKRDLGFTHKEITELTVPQINLLLQRSNEPQYKREIDLKLQEQKAKIVKGKKYGRRKRAIS